MQRLLIAAILNQSRCIVTSSFLKIPIFVPDYLEKSIWLTKFRYSNTFHFVDIEHRNEVYLMPQKQLLRPFKEQVFALDCQKQIKHPAAYSFTHL